MTRSSGLIVRRATLRDIETFSGSRPGPTVLAHVGEVDGEIVGLGGLARLNGRWVAFLDITDRGRAYKVSIVKVGLAMLRAASGKTVYAEPDPKEKNAVRLLTWLGFEPVDGNPGLMVWRD